MKKKSTENFSAVIPARLGSTRIPEKVLQKINTEFGLISLLENKIRQAQSVFDVVIVSCGDLEIASIAERLGAQVSWREMKFIKKNYTVTTEESIREVIRDVETEYVAWCPPVVPFHDGKIFENSVNKFLKISPKYDSLATVCNQKCYVWFNGKPLNYFPDHRHVQSQKLTPMTRVSNGIYVAKKSTMYENGYFLGKRPFLLDVGQIASLDIDDETDLLISRAVANEIWKSKK